MAIDKPSLNDFLPNGFETQDKTGWKQNFDSDKISTGYDKDTLEVLSGPNLNNLLDNVGKNTHTLQQFLNFFRDMPIGSFPVVNTSNQLDYKSVNSFFRNVGEIVFSAIPLEDGNLRLLDGSLLEYTMTYSRFISYIAGYRASLPNLFCTQAEFDQSVATYGVCGKFVYDSVTKSLRLPKISGFIKGTLDSGSLGDVDEAKAPNITGTFSTSNVWTGHYYHATDAFNDTQGEASNRAGDGGTTTYVKRYSFDASRSSDVYKNGATTIEPQAVKEFIYMVVSIDEAEKQVLSAVYNYKGSVENYSDLPTAVAIGEVYNVIGEDPEGYSGANFAWTGEEWDRLGGTVNLSGYLTKTEAGNTYATKASLESNVDYLQEQINTNATNIANIASQEVIDAGIQKIEMLKFASTLGAGKVTDTDLYSVIKKYKYSSFDITKFTITANNSVVSNPTAPFNSNGLVITKDGIFLGTSTNSSVRHNINDLPAYWGTEIKFKSLTTLPATSTQTVLFIANSLGNVLLSARIDNNSSRLLISYRKTDNNYQNTYYDAFSANTEYLLEIKGSGNNIIVNIDGVNFLDNNNFNNANNIAYIEIGSAANGRDVYTGKIDLKTFKYFENNEEVFNGRKEGMDILKPTNFNAYAGANNNNPILPFSSNGLIITENGIASGFSHSNYIESKGSFANVSSLEHVIKFKGKATVGSALKNIFSRYVTRLEANTNTIAFRDKNNTYIIGATLSNVSTGDTIDYELIIDNNSAHSVKVYKNNVLVGSNVSSTTADFTLIANEIRIGDYYQADGYSWEGSIDLNSFEIYADGDLIYQPMLRIPYNLSKTNLKITNELDRAIDVAEQCGFSQYYGLDEANQLCLVPQGENITGRRDLISRVEDSTTHYVTEIYSDLYCKQMGSGTASTAVTLNIPYKDEYYKLSVPQSAKSKTGFTPTASCDWTAEGYIYLDEVI